MIDGFSAATSLSPEIYLADIQVERFSRSLLVHHPITINCIDVHGLSPYIQSGARISDKRNGERDGYKIITIKDRTCTMTPLLMSSLGSPRTRKMGTTS
uniref:Uncharacterized protein n=1 Tax=Canis lupus dingo TaxID=286419 RepID=A0A8C0JJ47_CANLU